MLMKGRNWETNTELWGKTVTASRLKEKTGKTWSSKGEAGGRPFAAGKIRNHEKREETFCEIQWAQKGTIFRTPSRLGRDLKVPHVLGASRLSGVRKWARFRGRLRSYADGAGETTLKGVK